MKQEFSLGYQEQVIFRLRSLYNRRGYTQYRMSKFEEYDLYARNKDFLISDGIITFMDTSGKLLALKPDVTLSIVKNTAARPALLQRACLPGFQGQRQFPGADAAWSGGPGKCG